MSTLAEILDRLTGVVAIRERLSASLEIVAELRSIVFDHERRLLRIEARTNPPAGTANRKRLPPGR